METFITIVKVLVFASGTGIGFILFVMIILAILIKIEEYKEN